MGSRLAGIVLMLSAGAASGETLTGTFTYQDTSGRRPLSFARVEIIARDPGGIWTRVDVGRLGPDGRLNHNMAPPGPPLRTYALHIHAETPAAVVLKTGTAERFFARPGERTPGGERTVTVNTPFDVLSFGDFNFDDPWDVNHFNVAQTLQLGREYAEARRAPGETDFIDQMLVRTYFVILSYTDLGVMHLDDEHMKLDSVVLHEYAHHVQARIGALARIPAIHDGCNINGGTLQIEDLAWSEGFATYFAHAVASTLPIGTAPLDFPPGGVLEAPAACPHPGDTVEDFVSAALWDLVDAPNEVDDTFCGRDREVFSIFDRELDDRFGAATADRFANAWRRRGNDYPSLAATFRRNGLTPPAPPRPFASYDTDRRADLAVWTPGPTGLNAWRIENSSTGAPVTFGFGDPAQTPLPGDYDGDRRTDIAVFDQRTAEWLVFPSGSRTVAPRVWGLPGDVPIPGDYDGDGQMDFATYRPSTGHAFIQADTCGVDRDLDLLGLPSHRPVAGDFDGDGRDEVILVTAGGDYHLPGSDPLVSGNVGEGDYSAGDYDGDGRDEIAAYDRGSGRYLAFDVLTNMVVAALWGPWGEVPVPEDYDGDRRMDLATWSPVTGQWSIQGSSAGQFIRFLGAPGDTPVPSR